MFLSAKEANDSIGFEGRVRGVHLDVSTIFLYEVFRTTNDLGLSLSSCAHTPHHTSVNRGTPRAGVARFSKQNIQDAQLKLNFR